MGLVFDISKAQCSMWLNIYAKLMRERCPSGFSLGIKTSVPLTTYE